MAASQLPGFRGPLGLPLRLLAGLATVAGLFFLFLRIWAEVAEGDARAVDAAILLSLRVAGHPDVPIGPTWLTQSMIEVSSLGGTTLLGLLILAAYGYLVIKGARIRALMLATATLSGAWIIFLLKNFFERPRPELVDHLVVAQSMSFPSGHAANSALVYLTIAALASDVEPSRSARIYVMTVAMSLTILIGLSRLYLGVHWPSDVAAGWALGAGWALAWRLAVPATR
jgi:undecaprenyl-diphosphatase